MKVTLRRGGPPDADSIAELYLRARRAAAAAGTIPAPVHADEEVSNWVAEVVLPRLELWVAESSEGTVVGMLVLDGDSIEQLYVEPTLTGRGIGRQLLDLAKTQHPRGLRLWTFVSNLGAQRFYERHGFVAVNRTDGSGNEEGAPDIEYALGLAAPAGG